MRRKAGSLVALELAICSAAATLRGRGEEEFHGYEIAKTLGDTSGSRLLTAYGTLYRALGRLERPSLVPDILTILKNPLPEIRSEAANALAAAPAHARPEALLLATTPFSIAGGELTTNLKLRRGFIAEKFGPRFAGLRSAKHAVDGPKIPVVLVA